MSLHEQLMQEIEEVGPVNVDFTRGKYRYWGAVFSDVKGCYHVWRTANNDPDTQVAHYVTTTTKY